MRQSYYFIFQNYELIRYEYVRNELVRYELLRNHFLSAILIKRIINKLQKQSRIYHMHGRQFFPLGKAYGKAFCNRTQEIEQLIGNINSHKHTLIIAPRRYGKSSLAERVIEKLALPNEKINFHLCTTEEEVAELIMDTVIKLIGTSVGKIEKTIESLKKYLSNIEPLLSFGDKIASLKLIPKNKANPAVVITEALLLLEKLLREKNKKAILFFNEFQEIQQIHKHSGIEGAIRTAAQEMSQISIIFSGSIRALLVSLFENESRPLYKLCRKIKLDRIPAIEYEKHIQKIALDTWGERLKATAFNQIMELTHRHPYYVNYLCDSIWENHKKLPTLNSINTAWNKVIAEEWSDALREFSDLSINQRRLLKYIANDQTSFLTSQEAASALSMPTSTIASAISVLIERDYIELDNSHYYIINPLLLAVARGASN